MKKIVMFAVSSIILFCIVPIATIQAMPHQLQENENITTAQLNDSQKNLRGMLIELTNPVLKENVLIYDNSGLSKTTLAQGGKSRGSRAGRNNNPYVKREGYGSSDMGDDVDDQDDDEDDDFGDDSAVEYNQELREQKSILRDNPNL